jgi:hypothetical protein
MRAGIVVAVGGLVALTGCSNSSSGGATPQSTVTVTSTATVEASPSASPSPTTGATNLFLTPAIRRQLLNARARATHLPPRAFVRLWRGSAYYAIDNETGIYWAAGSTVPNHHFIRAEVYTQDEGAYTIFKLEPGGEWQTFDAGRDGPEARSGAQCPVQIPADVLEAWHWAPNTCDPPLDQLQ